MGVVLGAMDFNLGGPGTRVSALLFLKVGFSSVFLGLRSCSYCMILAKS